MATPRRRATDRWWHACPEHGKDAFPSGSCHDCAMLQPDPDTSGVEFEPGVEAQPTAHEETRARQTGATVTQLQTEQRIAELQASINAQIAELYELVSPTDQECNDHAEECHDDRRGSAESLAEDRMAQIEYALWVRNPENQE